MKIRKVRYTIVALLIFLIVSIPVHADTATEASHDFALTFFWIAIVLLVAKFSSLVEHFGQPAVLGELISGVILGNLVLIGLPFFEALKSDIILIFLAELGVVILLFQVGLESNLSEMKQVGLSATFVAIIGVVVPFVLGAYVIGPLLLPGNGLYTYLFLGAALTATSVGITARVFRDLGKLQSSEAQVVLGAAVLDDIMGLIILAVITAVVTAGSVSIGQVVWIILKAVTFLVVIVSTGILVAPHVNRQFSRINPGIGMKFTLIASSGLIFAYLAQVIGLAPIVGAFAAGLVLEPLHYRDFKDPEIIDDLRTTLKDSPAEIKTSVFKIIDAHSDHHVEELVEPVAHFFVPIFFVMTGMAVRLDVLFDPSLLLIALGITIVAIVGKLVSGLGVTGPTSKIIVGFSMVPRGEVGLIFATIGKSLGVVSDEVFSVIIIMVILTTLLTPPILTYLLKRRPAPAEPTPQISDSSAVDSPQILWQIFESYFGQKSTRQLKNLRIRGIHWKLPRKH